MEAVRAAVGLDLAEDGLHAALALEVELFAPVGRQDAAREVIRAAAAADLESGRYDGLVAAALDDAGLRPSRFG